MKKKLVDNNNKLGSSRMEVEYEEELKKISAADDSIEPEILRSVKKSKNNQALKALCNMKISNIKLKKKEVKKSLQDILYNINERKEAAKERGHKEKLKLLKELCKLEYLLLGIVNYLFLKKFYCIIILYLDKKGRKAQKTSSEESDDQENEN